MLLQTTQGDCVWSSHHSRLWNCNFIHSSVVTDWGGLDMSSERFMWTGWSCTQSVVETAPITCQGKPGRTMCLQTWVEQRDSQDCARWKTDGIWDKCELSRGWKLSKWFWWWWSLNDSALVMMIMMNFLFYFNDDFDDEVVILLGWWWSCDSTFPTWSFSFCSRRIRSRTSLFPCFFVSITQSSIPCSETHPLVTTQFSLGKVSSYTAQYPVLCTDQSALHFTPWQTCSIKHTDFAGKHSAML